MPTAFLNEAFFVGRQVLHHFRLALADGRRIEEHQIPLPYRA